MTRFNSFLGLALLCSPILAAAPATGLAATIGYHGTCYGEDPTVAITAAGHSPVNVAVLDAASLAPLDALMYGQCNYAANAAVDTAVANGLILIAHDQGVNASVGTRLPGTPLLVVTQSFGDQIDFPAGSPVLTGPGGTLTNASLDGGDFSYHGYAALSSLPVGSTVVATTNDPSQVTTLSYGYGAGRVVYSGIPLGCYLPGGNCDSILPTALGMQGYAANLLAWAVGPGFTSCAAEGYTGTKLTLCRQICEINQTPTRLTGLIRIWMGAYRSEPPCAR